MEETHAPGDELANSLTHGLGLMLSIVGFVLLVVLSSQRGDAWHIVSFSIFGASLVLLYAASTIYHSLKSEKWKERLQTLDHSAIF
ncbi:MAG: hemolysin III family protein, partial [Opitutaceae bacterium]